MKKILICGATGFMGKNISRYFSNLDGYEVYGVGHTREYKDWPAKKMYSEDMTTQAGVDAVFDDQE